MRSHADIISSADDAAIASARGVSIHTVRSWKQRDSIPAEHWAGIATMRLATLEELATYAASKAKAGRSPFPDQSGGTTEAAAA